MFTTLISLWVVRIPMAYILSKHFGEKGIWWAIPIGWMIGLILAYIYYLTGNWKKKVVI
jgi:Na+-driven multidrug efflux pump